MSEQQSGQNIEPIVKNKQEAERKFGCPCGKWYLSYPALFTHVKQKHEGKAPGQLIKPKTDKTRGRPRLSNNNNEEEHSIVNFDCVDELEKAIYNKHVEYDDEYEFCEGGQTCQDMGSQFLRIMGGTGNERRLITCFLNQLRFFVARKLHPTFWESQLPGQIIDIVNDIVREHQQVQHLFPLDKDTLIDLLFVLFRWMYKNKWTDHKLLKRNMQENSNK